MLESKVARLFAIIGQKVITKVLNLKVPFSTNDPKVAKMFGYFC